MKTSVSGTVTIEWNDEDTTATWTCSSNPLPRNTSSDPTERMYGLETNSTIRELEDTKTVSVQQNPPETPGSLSIDEIDDSSQRSEGCWVGWSEEQQRLDDETTEASDNGGWMLE